MTLEDAIEARQRGDLDIDGAVEGRISWGRALDGEPAITNQIISDPRPQHFKGFQRMRQTTVQTDVWARDPCTARALRDRLITVLIKPASVGNAREGVVRFRRAVIANIRGAAEQQQGQTAQRSRGELYRESIDFIFNHNAGS